MTRDLERLGLAPSAASAYLALLSRGPLTATALSEAIGITRSSGYSALRSLADEGLVETGLAHGSRYRAIPPHHALPALLTRRRDSLAAQLEEEEDLARSLTENLAGIVGQDEIVPEELVEIIRTPQATAERFTRLQLEADETIEVFVKLPIALGGGNPAQAKALSRGVRVRSLYEEQILSDSDVQPYLSQWVSDGEEGRIYRGELPFKLALFDSRIALLPLQMSEGARPLMSVLVRHPALAVGLRMLFDFMWKNAAPLAAHAAVSTPTSLPADEP